MYKLYVSFVFTANLKMYAFVLDFAAVSQEQRNQLFEPVIHPPYLS